MPRSSLSQTLDQQYEELLVRQAETIRDWSAGPERTQQAEIHIRTALLDQLRGRVSQDVLFRVYTTLNFAMPDIAPLEDEPVPLAELEREAAWEIAYHEQLEGQTRPA